MTANLVPTFEADGFNFHSLCATGDFNLVREYVTRPDFTELNQPYYFGRFKPTMDLSELNKQHQLGNILWYTWYDLEKKYNPAITPFHVVCSEGKWTIPTNQASKRITPSENTDYYNIAKLLISTPGFNGLNTPDSHGSTPFLMACEKGNLQLVELLLTTPGFDSFDQKNRYGHTPFLMACRNGHTDIVRLLIKTDRPYYPNIKYQICNAFTTVCIYGYVDIAKILMAMREFRCWGHKVYGSTHVHQACEFGHASIVKLLIQTPDFDDFNTKNNTRHMPTNKSTALHLTCEFGHSDVVVVSVLRATPCLESLFVENEDGYTPFDLACQNGHVAVVKILLRIPDFNCWNHRRVRRVGGSYKPLNLACERGHLNVVKELLKQPMEKNVEIDRYRGHDLGIKQLIESYRNNPDETRRKLIVEDKSNIFRLIVFLSDGFFQLRPNDREKPAYRFMEIAKELPIELQMKLIHKLVLVNGESSDSPIISTKEFETGLKDFIRKFVH